MADGKSIFLAAGIAFAVAAFGAGETGGSPVPARQDAAPPGIDAHKPVTYHFAVTNTTDKLQTVESVRTSCACLKVMQNAECRMQNEGVAAETTTLYAIPPGGVWPFEVVFDPAGMEGPVEKRVWVTLAPSKETRTYSIAENVRLRLGFKPMDAAFGVIRRSETGREIVAKLAGYAADGVKLDEPFLAAKNAKSAKNGNNLCDLCGQKHNTTNSLLLCASALNNQGTVFDVRLSPDGKSIVAKFRDTSIPPGTYAETWTIPTSDPEIPEIRFVVSARVEDAVSVTPQVITVGWDEPVCSRMVMVRGDDASRKERKERKAGFSVLSAETKPRKWGDVTVTPRPLNGWRIDIENIDPREVRQFSKRPFLEVKTNLPEMESMEIPLRVVNDGGAE